MKNVFTIKKLLVKIRKIIELNIVFQSLVTKT